MHVDSNVAKQMVWFAEKIAHANRAYAYVWEDKVLWTWQWWLQAAMMVIPIVVWIVVRKKKSTGRLLLAGLFVMLVTSWMDFVGNTFGLWHYPYQFVPTFPPFLPWETLITVEVLFLLQYGVGWNPWIKAIALSLVNSFAGEPLAVWLGLYEPRHWTYFYSVPFYIGIYLAAHRLARMRTFEALDSQ